MGLFVRWFVQFKDKNIQKTITVNWVHCYELNKRSKINNFTQKLYQNIK